MPENLPTLPNSLTRDPKVDWTISRPGFEWLYIFCASCGKDGGRVLKTDIPNANEFAFYLCDDCAQKHGKIDGCYMVPDEVFFAKVREAMVERHGRVLNTEETLIEIDNTDSYLLKLVQDRKNFVASQ